MLNQNLRGRRQFSGCLKTDTFSVPITFHAHLNHSGEIEFDFDHIAITQEICFLRDYLLPGKTGLSYFSLIGKSDDRTELEIERIHFSSEYFCDAENEQVRLSQGCYSKAVFAKNLAEIRHKPLIRMWLIGFKKSHLLTQDCYLGAISMIECSSVDDSDDLTGFLQIEAKNEESDMSAWHDEASKLLEHVRRVMSFASGLMLRVPIVEFYAGDKLTLEILSQIRQVSTASFPVFQSYDRKSIFEIAVNSFSDSQFKVKNLPIAIEWFVMDSSYAEVRLVNAMTVLENLVSSNLEENDKCRIPDKKKFKKFKESLRKEVKPWFEKQSENSNSQKITLSNFDETLLDLNRCSLRKKLDILANRWSIQLEDIGETRIKEMIKARNSIIHEGHYNIEHDKNLWEHAMVARELVIRFIFRALGFQGSYISHFGNYHQAHFSPKNDS